MIGRGTYAHGNYASPIFLKRLSHGKRLRVAAALVAPRAGQRILDFGAGDGVFTRILYELEPRADYVAFDPGVKRQRDSISVLDGTPLAVRGEFDGEFDTISCLETLEHIPRPIIPQTLRTMHGALSEGGRLIISVPIELGLPALGKNIVRKLIGEAPKLATWPNIVRMAFYRPRHIQQFATHEHIGFDYRDVRAALIAAGFVIVKTLYSPLPFGPVLNAQVFYVCRMQ